MTKEQIAAIVWAETQQLRELPLSAQAGKLDTARQLIARLAAADTTKIFTATAALSGPDAPAVMAIALDAARLIQPGDDQPRLLLWESTNGTVADRTADLPAPWGSLAANAIQCHGVFSAYNRFVWLFSRASSTDGGSGPVFASRVTGTGLSSNASWAQAGGSSQSGARPKQGLLMAFAAIVLFVLAAVWCVELGAGMAAPTSCLRPPAKTQISSSGGNAPTAPAVTVLHHGGFDAAIRCTVFNQAASPVSADPTQQSYNAVLPLAVFCLSLLLLLGAWGKGVTGLLAGALIDERNRLTLTLSQAAAWGVILFSALAAYTLIRIGYDGNLDEPFPDFNNTQYLFGIVGLTPALSKYALGLFGGTGPADAAIPDSPSASTIPDNLDQNAHPQDASLWDFVVSERAGFDNLVDMNRVQSVAMTLIVMAVYLAMLWSALGAIAAPPAIPVAASVPDTSKLLQQLPKISEAFLTILLASHATLLGGKALIGKTGPATPANS